MKITANVNQCFYDDYEEDLIALFSAVLSCSYSGKVLGKNPLFSEHFSPRTDCFHSLYGIHRSSCCCCCYCCCFRKWVNVVFDIDVA